MNRVDHHNSVLRRASRRALELEGKLAGLLEPILARAGAEAARKFEATVTNHLAAAALWERDAARLAAAGPALSRALVASLALRGAAPGVTSLSTMIAVKPRQDEAVQLEHVPGEPADTLHVTLAYLGEYDGDLTVIQEALQQVAASHAPLEGQVAGIGAFQAGDDGRPNILLPSVPGLVELRVEVTQALEQAGIDYSRDYGYVPHLTVAYTDDLNIFPSLGVLGEDIHFDDLLIVRGDTEIRALPFTGVTPVTASAYSVADDIAAVAEKHQPDGGYGETWWRESDGSVFWAAADWTSNEEIDLAVADFEAVEGVESVEACAECMPDGDGWDRVYSMGALTAAGPPAWSAPSKDEVINVDQLVSTLRTKTDPVRQAVVETTMKTTLDGAGVAFDVTNPFTAKVLSQAGSQITNIASSTQLNVMRIIDRSYNEGLSIPDTAKAIRAGMADAAGSRATLIARTELAGAVNGGSLAATQIVSEASGIGYTKVWLTAGGAIYPRHEEYDGLDGQATTLEGYFDVGGYSLQFPGDPDGPAEEVCNCRCTLIYEESGGAVIAEGGEEAAVLSPDELAAEAGQGDGGGGGGDGGGDGAALDALSLADEAAVASGPDVTDAAAAMYRGGNLTKEERFDAQPVAELDAHGESVDIASSYDEMYGRLNKEIDNADWSKANPGAKSEAYDATTRVGVDQVAALHDDSGRLLGIVDYNVPRSVTEIEDSIKGLEEDLNSTWGDPEYLRPMIDQLQKQLKYARDPNAVVGVNHLASTGIEKGVGARLMQQVAKDAAEKGRGVGLNSLKEAEGFYQRLGMTNKTGTHDYYWTADQAKQFAEAGYVSPVVDSAGMITGEPAAGAFDRAYSAWAERLSKEQIDSVWAYQSDVGFREVNAALRSGDMSGRVKLGRERPIDLSTGAVVTRLDHMMETSPGAPQDATLFRGIADLSKVFGKDGPKVGDRFTDSAYTSATTDRSTAEGFASAWSEAMPEHAVFEVEIPKDSKGLWMRNIDVGVPYDEAEFEQLSEFVLPRGSSFRVTGVAPGKTVYDTDVTVVKMRLEPPPNEVPVVEPPVPVPPPVDPVERLIAPGVDRPYSHWQKSTLDRQIIKSRSIVKEALSKDPTLRALTDKERVLYDRHRAKLELLLRERELRATQVARPFAHLADATLARKQVALRAQLRELDALANPSEAQLATKQAVNEQLRQITEERKYRKDHPDAVVEKSPQAVVVTPPAPPAPLTASQERMGRLKDAYARRPLPHDFRSVARMQPKEWEQQLVAAGNDFAKEVEERISRLDIHAPSQSSYALRVRRDTIQEVMSEVRPMGPPGRTNAWKKSGGKSTKTNTDAVVGAAEWAAKFYPREWVTTARASGAIKFIEDPLGRGYFREGFGGSRHEISLSGKYEHQRVASDPTYGRVAIHELGHLMETAMPDIRRAESAFYSRRTAGNEITTYHNDGLEPLRRDEFVNEYMGKDYSETRSPGPADNYEILSMGMQSILSGTDNLWFADPDYRNFILGLLVGL